MSSSWELRTWGNRGKKLRNTSSQALRRAKGILYLRSMHDGWLAFTRTHRDSPTRFVIVNRSGEYDDCFQPRPLVPHFLAVHVERGCLSGSSKHFDFRKLNCG